MCLLALVLALAFMLEYTLLKFLTLLAIFSFPEFLVVAVCQSRSP